LLSTDGTKEDIMSMPRPDVEGRVVWTRSDVDALERRLNQVDEELSTLQHRCASIESDVSSIERRWNLADVDGLDDLRRRVDSLTSDVQNVQRGW
jgi:septal ring factor EnvC (AmiA/AmiB activator)